MVFFINTSKILVQSEKIYPMFNFSKNLRAQVSGFNLQHHTHTHTHTHTMATKTTKSFNKFKNEQSRHHSNFFRVPSPERIL
jgi:hypothetical protein